MSRTTGRLLFASIPVAYFRNCRRISTSNSTNCETMPSYKAVQVVDPPNTKLVELPALPSATPGHIVVQNTFACVSPVDVLVNSNSFPGMIKPVPFTTGLEGVGVVTEVGAEVDDFKPGDYVTYVGAPAFAEYTLVPALTAVKTSSATAETMSVSYAACASASLEVAGEMKSGETVLVTAAAGGVGQYVVQLAKLAGNTVIGTTSSAEKAKFLLELGCDRVINYSEEDAGSVLTDEYPQGIDLLFDNVGGDFLVALVPHLAMFSRIVSFGVTSGYTAGPDTDKQKPGQLQSVLSALILKCASIRGISLGTNPAPMIKHRAIAQTLLDEGKLRPGIDPTVFAGLESVPDALAYVLAKRNMGKVAVQIQKLP